MSMCCVAPRSGAVFSGSGRVKLPWKCPCHHPGCLLRRIKLFLSHLLEAYFHYVCMHLFAIVFGHVYKTFMWNAFAALSDMFIATLSAWWLPFVQSVSPCLEVFPLSFLILSILLDLCQYCPSGSHLSPWASLPVWCMVRTFQQPTLIFSFGDKNSTLEILIAGWDLVWPIPVVDLIARITLFLLPQLWFLV